MVIVVENNIVLVDEEEQNSLLMAAEEACVVSMNASEPPDSDTHCPVVWDTVLCWPASQAGLIKQLCPNYINGFTITEFASRECTADGWRTDYPPANNTWTNYFDCYKNPLPTYQPPNNFALSPEDLMRIRIIYNVGYGLSLICLLLAVFIMIFFKKLHCQRNTIHINLFLSFILRAVLAFSRDAVLFDGLDNNDMNYNHEGNPDITGMHVRCRLLITLLNYAVSVNYSWIFVEGLYLHMLIFVSVFSESSSVRWYIILGWLFPLSFIVPWIIVRLVSAADNVMCWNTHPTAAFAWIVKGPIAVTISVTFVFFLNIVRVLFTKMNATNTPEARKYRYRKLAKSTLVLIPLFGVHYVILLAWPDDVNNSQSHVIKLYFELSTSSIQGFLVALLFCFLNSEVQTEIRKKFNRLRLGRAWSSQHSRNMSDTYTYTTYANRRSRAGSTPPPGANGSMRHNGPAPDSRSKITFDSKSYSLAGDESKSVVAIVVTGPGVSEDSSTKLFTGNVTFAMDAMEMSQLMPASNNNVL